jgi:hypothetical protein
MAGFGQNDEVVSPKTKPFGTNDEVVPVASEQLPAYGDNAAWAAKAGQNQNPGFFDKGGTVDRFIKGTGLSNIPNDLSESVGNFVHNPTPGNLPIVGPSIDSATRLLTGTSASPIHDIANSVPIVGPAANAVGEYLARGEYPEAAGGATALLAPGLHGEPSPGLNLAEGDTLTPGFGSRAASGMKAAAPQVGKGLAKIGAGATAFEAIPGEAGRFIVGYPLVRSGMHDVGRGVSAGMEQFRGPVQGPEVAPKGFKSPYPTLPYENPTPSLIERPSGVTGGRPLPQSPSAGPSSPSVPSGPGPGYSGTQYPPATGRGGLPQSPPVIISSPRAPGGPSFLMPSDYIKIPQSGPLVDPWNRFASVERPQPSSAQRPDYSQFVPPLPSGAPSSSVIEPGRGPGLWSSGDRMAANPSPVEKPLPASAAEPPSGVIRIGQTPAEAVQSASNSNEGTLGTRAAMMHQLRMAGQQMGPDPRTASIIQRFESPEYTQRPDREFIDPRESQIMAQPLPSSTADTPAAYRARANVSRAKFGPDGQNNQLRPKK